MTDLAGWRFNYAFLAPIADLSCCRCGKLGACVLGTATAPTASHPAATRSWCSDACTIADRFDWAAGEGS